MIRVAGHLTVHTHCGRRCVYGASAAVTEAQIAAAASYETERLTQQRKLAELRGRVEATRMTWQIAIQTLEVPTPPSVCVCVCARARVCVCV